MNPTDLNQRDYLVPQSSQGGGYGKHQHQQPGHDSKKCANNLMQREILANQQKTESLRHEWARDKRKLEQELVRHYKQLQQEEFNKQQKFANKKNALADKRLQVEQSESLILLQNQQDREKQQYDFKLRQQARKKPQLEHDQNWPELETQISKILGQLSKCSALTERNVGAANDDGGQAHQAADRPEGAGGHVLRFDRETEGESADLTSRKCSASRARGTCRRPTCRSSRSTRPSSAPSRSFTTGLRGSSPSCKR